MKKKKNFKRYLLYRKNLLIIGSLFILSSFIFGLYMEEVEHLSKIDTIYYLITTATTVGYGDISPKTDIGKMLGIWYMVISITSLGVLIGVIGERLLKIGLNIKKGIIIMKKDVDLLIVGYPSEEKIKDIVEELCQSKKFEDKNIVIISHKIEEKPEWFNLYNIAFIRGLGSDEEILNKANIMNVKKALILAERPEDISSDDFSSSTVAVIESINNNVHTIVEKVRKSSALFIAARADIITKVSSANVLAQEILNEGAIEFERAIFDSNITGTQLNLEYTGDDIVWKDLAISLIMEGKIPEGFKNPNEEFNFLPSPEDIVQNMAIVKYRG